MVNQLNARNTDSAGGDEFTLTYDGVGNLTDDGQAYEYVYDAWGRLCTVKNTSNQATIASYRYNALNQRIMFHEDTEPDGDVDANDPKYYLIYDERWRHIATYRADDDNPKELFVYHQAGLDGSGSSSYIDSVILRQRDANSGWTSAADGTLEERRYYCQNWRADVSAIITSGGLIVEWAKYSSYGIPFGLPGGDTDSDGDCDATDITQIQTWIDAPAYDVRGDINLDGSVNATDKSLAINNYQGTTSGWNVLSAAVVANRIGYAGYQQDINLDLDHVRNRVLEPHLGRWTRRDPLGYVDGMGLYEYLSSHPLPANDPNGLASGQSQDEKPPFISPLKPSPLERGLPWDGSDSTTYDPSINPSQRAKDKCCEWWRLNVNATAWKDLLPNCPCILRQVPIPPWKTDRKYISDYYHPGSTVCVRSPAIANGATQQCCYDASGDLITWGWAAGTPDKNEPGGHFPEDVTPWDWCREAGQGGCYFQCRPPQGIPCRANPVNTQRSETCTCNIAE